MDRKIGALTLREVTAIALLLVLLLGGLLSGWYLERQHRDLARQLEDSAWLALSGQMSNARQEAQAAQTQWKKGRSLQAVLGDHTPMEDIDDLFAELQICGAAGEKTEFARICSILASRIEAMENACKLSWWNIL